MIKLANRLIAGAVVSSTLQVLLVLVALDGVSALVNELDEIKGSYALSDVLLSIGLTLPRRAYELFPTAMLVGTLLGLGALAARSELVALRAAGMSRLRIGMAVMSASAAMLVAVVVMGETVAPEGELRAQRLILQARSESAVLGQWSGLWLREGNRFINARRAIQHERTDGSTEVELLESSVYEFDGEGRLMGMSDAVAGTLSADGLSFEGVRETRIATDEIVLESFPSASLPTRLDVELIGSSLVRPRYLSLRDLSSGLEHLRANELDTGAFESAYWARVFYPLTAMALVLACVPFAFGALRSGGMGKRLFIGILFGVGFYFLQRAAVNLAEVYRFDLRLAYLLPALLLVAGAVWSLRRSQV